MANFLPQIRHRRSGPDSGFTMIELLVTLALIGIVSAGLITTFISQQDAHLGQEQVVAMQQNIRSAVYLMTREIRMAGYDPYSGTAGAGIINAGNGSSDANALTFSYVADDDGIDNSEDTDNDGILDGTDGVTDEKGELKTVSFYLYDAYDDGDNDLGMKIGTANVQAIAENIDAAQFSFSYLKSDGTVAASLNEITAVQVNITSQQDVGTVDRTGQDAKRTVSTIIQCRNLNLN